MSFGENLDDLVENSTNRLVAAHPSWERVRLGEVAQLVNGYPFSSTGFNSTNGTPVVRIRDISRGQPETRFDGDLTDTRIPYIDNGQIVIGMDGDFNCRIWQGGTALLNQRVCTVDADEDLYSQKLLAFALPGYLKLINDNTSSITVKHLSSKTVQDIPLPLPPLPEQRRIVEKIETLFARLDKGEEAVRLVQALLKRYRQSVLKAAVMGELTADWREANRDRLEHCNDLLARILKTRRETWEGRGRYKEPVTLDTSGLPELPEGWVWATVDTLLRAGLSNGRSVPNGPPSGFPVLRLTALKDGQIDLRERKAGAWSSTEGAPFAVQFGDVLVSRGNGSKTLVGRGGLVGAVPDAVAFPDTMIRIPLNLECVEPKWFLQIWNSPFMRAQIESAAKTTAGIHKINQGDISGFKVPVPPISEQRKASEEVERLTSQEVALSTWSETELTRSSALRQSILKQAFSGRLVPQDPSDEPASALLARIRAASTGTPKRRPTKATG
ncbi:restriction endonuclease subunit S [Roseibacterium sp. SDUM158017]|uniref:restriction endonuclease subunit S n=1 Tax=Roseicyclus salinarum TaxID=3036773 RepID=UPI0024153FA2|nr:restriction endonuclease subunit S [Roseibacterium sp. SDUM158017]MDG4648021.1 restriction endonuclease subunit S [Roseibacterium sp. SDUM158017]